MDLLLEKLVEKEIISLEKAKKLEKDMENLEGSKDEFLIKEKIIDEKKLDEIKSEVYGIEVFTGSEANEIPNNILSLIPEESAIFYKVIP
ncbi:MAG TPA: hypothetical protein PKM85_01060, partial [Candidatus Pacearchaeota archaeon]|nr:hypothetical protein [Candidatus Pacearchaeota archaeon]